MPLFDWLKGNFVENLNVSFFLNFKFRLQKKNKQNTPEL